MSFLFYCIKNAPKKGHLFVSDNFQHGSSFGNRLVAERKYIVEITLYFFKVAFGGGHHRSQNIALIYAAANIAAENNACGAVNVAALDLSSCAQSQRYKTCLFAGYL